MYEYTHFFPEILHQNIIVVPSKFRTCASKSINHIKGTKKWCTYCDFASFGSYLHL